MIEYNIMIIEKGHQLLIISFSINFIRYLN